ncbi:16S rRNA (cytosine(967)-C(5))-methyltransferase RsmB [Comamonadaceae bacterium G21597-S1]|nr:16S rRNA (cytosine(967)-C(5))-methyltransferase RsmB [Comamonadaceae bacterium G21597-S1]
MNHRNPPQAPAASASLPGATPLWRLLQATAACLMAVRGGRSGTAALDQVEPALRPAVQALSFQVWRSLARADNLRRLLAHRAPPPQADALLCVVLALAWNESQAPYPSFTLVDQAVEAAKRHTATRAQAGFINGCLRRFLREREALVARSGQDPVARWNHPAWWIARVRQDHPHQWQQVLEADRSHAPMTLRVNVRRSSQAACLAQLEADGIAAVAVGPSGIRLARPMPVQRIPGFDAGLVSVQDAAAQLAAPLLLHGLAPQPGRPLRILDACAAPGGKTAHLLESADCTVTALDVDPARCARIHQTLERLGLQADVRAADAAQPASWWQGEPFDAILLDAPCTASGIVRRHPDVPWLRRASDVDQLAQLQARLLAALWPLLAPGGRMLYCTCSVFRAEGDIQIQTFVEHNTDAALLPSPGHLLPRSAGIDAAVPDNGDGDHDGFFYALLEKRAP